MTTRTLNPRPGTGPVGTTTDPTSVSTSTSASGPVALSGQQSAAVRRVADWYRNPHAKQTFRLFGYAGTGKTTLARLIAQMLGLDGQDADRRALYAAFTGKAAHVLRTKGCDGAMTVHSLIYTPVAKVREKLDRLRKELEEATTKTERRRISAAIRVEEDRLAKPDFVLKEDSLLDGAPLLVLDEVSMIGERIAHDLLGFGTRLLVLGDPAQLPPVEGGGWFINHNPDVLLTEIHRSAWDSPVTRLATAVRESQPGDWKLGLGPDGDSGPRRHIEPADLAGFDQVLCGTNRTRWTLTNVIRGLYGFTGSVPRPGERIIVLANNREAGVFNGQQFTVAAANPDPAQPDILNILGLDPATGDAKFLQVWASGFAGHDGEKLAKRHGRSPIVAATFAHAITVHKAQGSQWDRVLVVDESAMFGRMAFHRHKDVMGRDAAGIEAHVARRRWTYTAITRAAEQVVIVPGVDW